LLKVENTTRSWNIIEYIGLLKGIINNCIRVYMPLKAIVCIKELIVITITAFPLISYNSYITKSRGKSYFKGIHIKTYISSIVLLVYC